jgi:hypothetical protein
MAKRIPIQSSIPGFSKKSWVKFVMSLSDEDLAFICTNSLVEYNEYLLSRGLPRVSKENEVNAISITPPSPRLVGIELNPGPQPFGGHKAIRIAKGNKMIGGLANDIANVLGAGRGILPPKMKVGGAKKKKKVRGNLANRIANGMGSSTTIVSAPVAVGSVTRSIRHKPVIIDSRNIACTLGTNAVSVLSLTNAVGALSSGVLTFNIDITGFSTASNDFQWLPSQIRTMAYTFGRYRFRKLVAHYNPIDPTSAGRSVAFASAADTVSSVSSAANFSQVLSFENSVSTPSWNPCSLDLLGRSGLRKDWLFVDNTKTVVESELRQEAAGVFLCSVLGASPPFSTTIGYFTFDWVIEFDGITNNINLLDPQPSSLPPLPHPNLPGSPEPAQDPHNVDMEESIYIDRGTAALIRERLNLSL